jgi:hypothetical protein
MLAALWWEVNWPRPFCCGMRWWWCCELGGGGYSGVSITFLNSDSADISYSYINSLRFAMKFHAVCSLHTGVLLKFSHHVNSIWFRCYDDSFLCPLNVSIHIFRQTTITTHLHFVHYIFATTSRIVPEFFVHPGQGQDVQGRYTLAYGARNSWKSYYNAEIS